MTDPKEKKKNRFSSSLEYKQVHRWLIVTYGNATKCENSNCTYNSPKRFEWALLKRCKYKKDKSCFIQLCPSCHRKYDFTESQRYNISAANIGKKLSDEAKAKISAVQKGRKRSEFELQRCRTLRVGKGFKSENPNSKKVLNTKTGEIYGSIIEAAEKNNMTVSALRHRLSKNNIDYLIKHNEPSRSRAKREA